MSPRVTVLAALLGGLAWAQTPFDSATISGLRARNIGSAAMSGRISALDARRLTDHSLTLFVGAASGGVWRSRDGGTTFKPVFDKQPVQSIGAITIDPKDPQVVWVGTGESWTRNSVSVGNGIYRSRDGGESWDYLGLPESERIAKIVVDPRDSQVVYVCVPGRLWSDSSERGLYKTVDGGKTWSKILAGANLSTGCASLTLDPQNPDVLLAGMWDFRRQGWTFRSGGETPQSSSGSGLWRSLDGGKSWSPVQGEGLPAAPWGRVEVEIAPSDSRRVYAFVEAAKSALFVSEDGGFHWQKRDASRNMVWRPFYFANLIVDPKNANRLFKTNLGLIVSEDGGKSFSDASGGSHCDWHDVWIDPDDPKHVIGGDDGGLWISHDGGSRWWKVDNLPISQFYHVSLDDKDPYQVYGGLQDNSSWVGDSAYPGGITNSRWENLYGGDGFWAFADPSDPNFAYAESQGGNLSRIDRRTLSARDIQPRPGVGEKLRFNWNTPVHLSPNRKGSLYLGAQFLFRSDDQGQSWQRLSPDLTRNDPAKQKQELSGGITVDNSAAETHCTIYSISESPRNPKLVWVGTDDGLVQLTRDGGKSWRNVTPNLPDSSWISWVEASPHRPGTAFVTVDRHTVGDFQPYLWRTDDYGQSWRQLTNSSSLRGYLHVVKEDPVRADLLYVGSEFGLWVSPDSGSRWAAFQGGNFPSVAVRDLAIQPRDHDLVVATHGRGIWILDDLTPLRQLGPEQLAQEACLIASRPTQQRMPAGGGWVEGDAKFIGENPAGGAVIHFYQQKRHIYGPLKLEIFDSKGQLLDTLPVPKRRGLSRIVWSMRHKAPKVPKAASIAGASLSGPRVLPGTYRVRVTKGDKTYECPLVIGLDRRAPYTAQDRQLQWAACQRVGLIFERMSLVVDDLRKLEQQCQQRTDSPPCQALLPELAELRKKLVATTEGGAITGEERLREKLDSLYASLNGYEGRPATYQLEYLKVLEEDFAQVEKTSQKLLQTTNQLLQQQGQQPLRILAGELSDPDSARLLDQLVREQPLDVPPAAPTASRRRSRKAR